MQSPFVSVRMLTRVTQFKKSITVTLSRSEKKDGLCSDLTEKERMREESVFIKYPHWLCPAAVSCLFSLCCILSFQPHTNLLHISHCHLCRKAARGHLQRGRFCCRKDFWLVMLLPNDVTLLLDSPCVKTKVCVCVCVSFWPSL